MRKKRPVDALGQPIPWWPPAATQFLARLLAPSVRVFEYGTGYSTAWIAARGAQVSAVEHDAGWCKEMQELTESSGDATIVFRSCRGDLFHAADDDDYVSAPGELDAPFDVIVVDGVARSTCMARAVDFLAPKGVLVVDDTDWWQLASDIAGLEERGFVPIDFSGVRPEFGQIGATSFFSRDWSYPLGPEWRARG